MKRNIVFILIGTVIYSIVCGIAWSWVLGLPFDWWKLPIVGLINFVLNLIGNSLLPKNKNT